METLALGIIAIGAVKSSVKAIATISDWLPASSTATNCKIRAPSGSFPPKICSNLSRLKEKLPSACKSSVTSKLINWLSNPANKLTTVPLSSVTVPAIEGSDVILSLLLVPVSLTKEAAITGGVISLLPIITVVSVVVTLPAISVAITVRVFEPVSKLVNSRAISNAPFSTVIGTSVKSLKR